jgi:predicted transcriptional regulator
MPQINFECPEELKTRLDAYAKSKYTSSASIIRQCLALFLSNDYRKTEENSDNVLSELLSDGNTQPPAPERE